MGIGETPEERYRRLYEEMWDICEHQGWGDPFSYARSKEIYAATKLGHRVAPDFSGADAIGPNDEGYEYKSTIDKRCKGSYTGISVQPTWKEQEEYLIKEKIGKYPKHYYNRFEDGKLVESWEMDAEDVLGILLPKMERKYANTLNKKDPRLSANVCWGEIKKNGRRVI
jgi:hypothetical protein